MKIILTSVGTRGDMEPHIALGEMLKAKGHQVICTFPEQYRELVEDADLEFASLGSKYIKSLESDAGKAAMGGSSGLKKLFAYIKLAFNQKEANKEFVVNQYEFIEREKPDRVIYNAKSVYPIIWELKNLYKAVLISPLPYMHYVKGHSFIAFGGNYGECLNKLTFKLLDFGTVTTVMISKKWMKIKGKITRRQIKEILRNRNVIYTISPSLFPRPDYWNDNIKVLGYQERNKTINWEPEKKLIDFIERNIKILFVTFGSMINPKPKEKTKIVIDILERNKIPAIINTASGGLIKPDKFNSDLIYFVSQIPYDWIFPKMYAVIHHGGAGTTHLALKYGCATMIIPHVIDQFVWKEIVYEKGVGPKGIKINKISSKNLEPKIIELMGNHNFKENAELISDKMRNEDFKEEIYETIIE